MKTSIITLSLIVCSLFVSVASAQSLHIGIGRGQLSIHGSRGGSHAPPQVIGCEHLGGHHGGQAFIGNGGQSFPVGTPGVVQVGQWSEWRPVGPTLPQQFQPRTPRPSTPMPSTPGQQGLFGPATPMPGGLTPAVPQVIPTPRPVTPQPAASNPLIGTWKASDRAIRIEAGNRFTVAWMNNGSPQQASGTFSVHGKTIIFKSDAGEVWPWQVEGYVNGQLTMSHADAGQRVFQRVNG